MIARNVLWNNMDQQMKFLSVGQEVEAKFNTSGFRGAWFLCRILEIKDGRGEPSCLLKYLHFEDDPTWHKARQPDPAAKPKYWMKGKKTLHWMIRPTAPALIPECDLEGFKKRAALKEKKDVTVVALFDNEYMVGDMVEWWKDDAWWTGRITELFKTDKGEVVTLALLSFPHGEGLTFRGIKTSKLRPAFSWSRQNQWNLLLSKTSHRRAIGEKPRVQIIYLPSDSSSPLNSQQCGSKDLGSVQLQSTTMRSECKGHLANFQSECTSERRHSSSDLTDLVATSSTPYSSNGNRPHEVGKSDCSTSVERRHRSMPLSKAEQETLKEKGRRRSLFSTTSFYASDSDTDELVQSAAEPKPQPCSTKMRVAIARGTKVHISIPGHDGEVKDSSVDTEGPISTIDKCPQTEKLLNTSSSAEISLPLGNLTKTRVMSWKESSNMEESRSHEHLGCRSVEVYLPTENLLEVAEEPQLNVKETLCGDTTIHQILPEDVCREGEMGHKLEMALDSKCDAKRKVATTIRSTARQISGSSGCSQGLNTSWSGRADAEIYEMATTLVNHESTNKVDEIIAENTTSNFGTGNQSSRRVQPSQVLDHLMTMQPTKQKQRATKLQEHEFRLKTLKKAKDVFNFWRKRKFAGSEAVPVVKRQRLSGLKSRSKIPVINCNGNEIAESIRDVVLSSAPPTPVHGENREFHSVCHTDLDVPMEEENNERPVTKEAELVDTLEMKSGKCEVSVAPIYPVTTVEGDKGRVTLSSLQECSEKVTHTLVDDISTTESSCKKLAVEKSYIYPAEEIQVNDVDLEAELDDLERLTERIDGLKWQVNAMKKRGKRKRAANLRMGLDGNKKETRVEPVSSPIVCGEPSVKKLCVGRMEILTESTLDLKDRKTSLADSTGSMEKCAGVSAEISRMRCPLNMEGQCHIAAHAQRVKRNQRTGTKRRRKISLPTKIPVPLKPELPEGPQVQLSGYTGSEGRNGINLTVGPVAFDLQESEQTGPMGHQKKQLGGQRARSEAPSNIGPSSVSNQEDSAVNSKTVDKLKTEDTQSVERMSLSPLRDTPETPSLAVDSIPKATQGGSDGLVMISRVNSVAAQAVKMGKATKPRQGISGAGTTSSSLQNVNRDEKESQLQELDYHKDTSGSVCGGIRDRQRAQIQCDPVNQGNVLVTTSCKGATDKWTSKSSGLDDPSARLHRSNVTVVDQRTLESPRTIPNLNLAGQHTPLGNAGEVFQALKDSDSIKCNQKMPPVSTEVHERSCALMPTKVKQENGSCTAILRCNEVLVQSQESKCAGVLERLEKLKDEFDSASQRPFKTIQEQEAVAKVAITLWQSVHCGVQDSPTPSQGQMVLKQLKVISEMLKITDHDPVGSTFNVVLRAFDSEDLHIGLYKTQPEAIAVCSMISRCQKAIREFLSTYNKSTTPTMEFAVTSKSGENQPRSGHWLGHPVPSTCNVLSNIRVHNSTSSTGDASVQKRPEVLNMQAPMPVETTTTRQSADQPRRRNYPLQPSGAGNICSGVQVSNGVPISKQLLARTQVQDVSGRLGGFTKQAPASLIQHTQSPQNQDHPVNISWRDVVTKPLAKPNNIIVLDDDDDDDDDDIEDACIVMPPEVNLGSRTSGGHTQGQAGSVHSVSAPQAHLGGSPGCGDGLQFRLQPTVGTGLTRGVPINRHTGEVARGNMSVPANMTGGQTMGTKRLYNCCMGTEATKLDHILIRALHCNLCDWLMHTECAITQRKLAPKRFYFNGEEHKQIIYICNCKKAWAVLPSLLSRIKYFLDLISKKQKSASNQAGGNPAAVRVVELIYARELLSKMQLMLKPTQSPILKCIYNLVSQMLYTDPNAANYQVFVDKIDNAANLIKGMWIRSSRTMLPTA